MRSDKLRIYARKKWWHIGIYHQPKRGNNKAPKINKAIFNLKAKTSWFNDKNIKFPNKFIGVQSESQLKKISKTELCELRYTSHINEITNLKNNNFRALYFEYENRFEHANLLEKYLNIKIDKTILR